MGLFYAFSAKSVKFSKKSLQIYFFDVYLQSQKIIGVWRSWLAHLVWDQRVLCSSHSTPTKRAVDFQLLFFLYIFDLAGRAAMFGSLDLQFVLEKALFVDKLVKTAPVLKMRVFKDKI